MPWANLDDHFHDNPKVLETPLPGVGLYAIGLSYCSAHMTDGFIPQAVVRGIRGWTTAARMLTDRKLWEPVEGGFRVHDYLQWNRSRAQVLADRAAAADRKRMSRRTPAGQNGRVRPESHPDVRPESQDPVRPESGRSHTTPARDQSNPTQSNPDAAAVAASPEGGSGETSAGFRPLGALLGKRPKTTTTAAAAIENLSDEARAAIAERLGKPPLANAC